MPASSLEPKPASWQPPATERVLHETAAQLVATFRLRACRFEPFPFDAQMPRIEPGRIVVPAAEPGIASWSGEPGVELPVRHRGLTLGRFVLVPSRPTVGVAFSPSGRAAAISIVAGVNEVVAARLLADAPNGAARAMSPPERS